VSAQFLPSGSGFARRIIGIAFLVSMPALAIVLFCLVALLDLTAEQWSWFFGATLVYAVAATFPMAAYQSRMLAPIAAWLDRRGDAPDERETREAFARASDLPRRVLIVNGGGWLVPVVVIGIAMELRWPAWGSFETGVVMLAGAAAAFVGGTFAGLLAKRVTAPVCEAIATALPDPLLRGSLVLRIPLRTKLLASVIGLTVVTAMFAVLLAEATTSRAVDRVAIAWQRSVLDGSVGAPAGPGATAPASPTGLAGALRIESLDLADGASRTKLEAHVLDHLRAEVAAGRTQGDSATLPTRHVFAWRRVDDGTGPPRIVAAVAPRSALAVDTGRTRTVFALLLLVSTGIALSLAALLSGDVSRATQALRLEAERLARGDLRPGRVFESEDELGELARSFEAMAAWLRETVSRVARAADRVEATAGTMADVSTSMSSVTADQVRGIREATTSMESIDAQARGIAASSAALGESVEESSSSVLELGAAGSELNDTARVLRDRVDEVSSSIEQAVASVRAVLENTEALSSAAVETSSSMGEMARSMSEVDASAEEASRLSRDVVSSADAGQAAVGRTIEGMEAIRRAVEAAEEVIRTLSSRTEQIGAIVDVIDDVADETNLLALNAAIIAAQAGEHGRAFSVVADEIKDLADRTLSSTKEIAGLIRSVQAEGSKATRAIGEGTRAVGEGLTLSEESGSCLDAITGAARESGHRITGIGAAVREQARAASHVVELMERVRSGVEQIRQAAVEQDRGNEVAWRGSVAMREAAGAVKATTEEQARGSGRIRESIEGVREAVEQINRSLQEQSGACRSALEFLEAVYGRTRSNEASAERLDNVTRDLVAEAQALRDDVRRFRVSGGVRDGK
jgi:methyl-accepting chemotaxis protein